jgi:hypothetical protein
MHILLRIRVGVEGASLLALLPASGWALALLQVPHRIVDLVAAAVVVAEAIATAVLCVWGKLEAAAVHFALPTAAREPIIGGASEGRGAAQSHRRGTLRAHGAVRPVRRGVVGGIQGTRTGGSVVGEFSCQAVALFVPVVAALSAIRAGDGDRGGGSILFACSLIQQKEEEKTITG